MKATWFWNDTSISTFNRAYRSLRRLRRRQGITRDTVLGTTKQFSAGLLASHSQRVSGDSGAGANLGSYKGRVTAVGAQIAYSFEVAGTPVTTRLKVLREVAVDNRTQGTIGLFTIVFPIGHASAAPTAPDAAPAVVKRQGCPSFCNCYESADATERETERDLRQVAASTVNSGADRRRRRAGTPEASAPARNRYRRLPHYSHCKVTARRHSIKQGCNGPGS